MTSVVLINGSFGIGKTSVARELARRLPGSVIYDPEWAGMAIQRLPSWVRLAGRGTDDFQDVDLWRRSVAAGTRLFRACSRGPVLVPMTFWKLEYLAFVLAGIRAFEPEVRVFCLSAPLETIRQRLRDRGVSSMAPKGAWILERAERSVRAHQDPRFGEPVETAHRSIVEVADQILGELTRDVGI